MDELQSWLDDNWDPDLTVGEWWERLGLSGWAAPLLPPESYGRGLSRGEALAVQQTIAEHGALGAPVGLGLLLAAPTIATHGTPGADRPLPPRHRHRPAGVVPAVQRAGRRVRPRRAHHKGNSRTATSGIVNGQKVWTSGGQIADLGMLLARTNPTCRSTRASRTSRSTCTSPASRCGRCGR